MKTFAEFLNEAKKFESELSLSLDGDKFKKAQQTAIDNSIVSSNDDESTIKKLVTIHHFESKIKSEIAKLIAKTDKNIDVYDINIVGALTLGFKQTKNNDITFYFTYNIDYSKNKKGDAKISNNKLSITL